MSVPFTELCPALSEAGLSCLKTCSENTAQASYWPCCQQKERHRTPKLRNRTSSWITVNCWSNLAMPSSTQPQLISNRQAILPGKQLHLRALILGLVISYEFSTFFSTFSPNETKTKSKSTLCSPSLVEHLSQEESPYKWIYPVSVLAEKPSCWSNPPEITFRNNKYLPAQIINYLLAELTDSARD